MRAGHRSEVDTSSTAAPSQDPRRLGAARDRLRIAYVTPTFPPRFDGTSHVAYHNAREMVRLGHEVHVFTLRDRRDDGSSPDPAGARVHRLAAQLGIGNARLPRSLSRALSGSAFDLVHLHYPFYFGSEQVWLSCARRRIPYVVTYHQDVILPWPASLVAEAHHRLLGLRILRAAAAIASTSRDYAAASRLAALRNQCIVEIPNGVDPQRFRPGVDGEPLRARLGLGSEPIVLFVGALDRSHYFKGISVLLEAMHHVPDALLLLIGDGDRRQRYQREATRQGLDRRVRFAGHAVAADLPACFALAQVVVLPSTTRGEAFGLVLLEAMACGRAVVASRLPGVRSVVDDGETGLLAEPGNARDLAAKIEALLAQPGMQARMGAAGRRKALTYDWREVGMRLERLYYDVLGITPGDAGARRTAEGDA